MKRKKRKGKTDGGRTRNKNVYTTIEAHSGAKSLVSTRTPMCAISEFWLAPAPAHVRPRSSLLIVEICAATLQRRGPLRSGTRGHFRAVLSIPASGFVLHIGSHIRIAQQSVTALAALLPPPFLNISPLLISSNPINQNHFQSVPDVVTQRYRSFYLSLPSWILFVLYATHTFNHERVCPSLLLWQLHLRSNHAIVQRGRDGEGE